MKFFIIILLCFFFSPLVGNSQAVHDSIQHKERLTPKVILKWAPLSLIDIYSAVQFALEYRIGGRSTVQGEAGYIFPINILESGIRDDYNDMNGYRLRAEYRYYLSVKKNRTDGFYLAPELFFISINFDEKNVVKIPLNSVGDFYYQEKQFKVNKRIFGYHLKVGYQQMLTERLVIDFYGGLGVRHINFSSDQPLEDWLNKSNSIFFSEDREQTERPSASYGIKLGILLY